LKSDLKESQNNITGYIEEQLDTQAMQTTDSIGQISHTLLSQKNNFDKEIELLKKWYRYELRKSKTGLGKGLLGTKRLSDHFDVATGNDGTLVVSEVLL